MKYEEFLKLILSFKKFTDDINELYDMGFNLMDGTYNLVQPIENMLDTTLQSNYTTEGVDWVYWFMFEADYGMRDFSDSPTYRKTDDGKLEIVNEEGDVRWGARDENGNSICYSYESLYEYIQQYKK
jgi:hypothetical protein